MQNWPLMKVTKNDTGYGKMAVLYANYEERLN